MSISRRKLLSVICMSMFFGGCHRSKPKTSLLDSITRESEFAINNPMKIFDLLDEDTKRFLSTKGLDESVFENLVLVPDKETVIRNDRAKVSFRRRWVGETFVHRKDKQFVTELIPDDIGQFGIPLNGVPNSLSSISSLADWMSQSVANLESVSVRGIPFAEFSGIGIHLSSVRSLHVSTEQYESANTYQIRIEAWGDQINVELLMSDEAQVIGISAINGSSPCDFFKRITER